MIDVGKVKNIITDFINENFTNSPFRQTLLNAINNELFQVIRFLKFLNKIRHEKDMEKDLFLFALIYQDKFAIQFLDYFLQTEGDFFNKIIMEKGIEKFIKSMSKRERVLYYYLLRLEDKSDHSLMKRLRLTNRIIQKYTKILSKKGELQVTEPTNF